MGDRAPTILIVDTDADCCESTKELLQAHGYRVTHASSGYEALRRARIEPPDLILMDVMMEQRTDGFFTVQQIRRDRGMAEIPILVVSSIYREVPEFGAEPASRWAGADGFTPKPVDPEVLLAMIGQRLEPTVPVDTAATPSPAEPG